MKPGSPYRIGDLRSSCRSFTVVSYAFNPRPRSWMKGRAQSAVTAALHSENRRSEIVTALQTSSRVL